MNKEKLDEILAASKIANLLKKEDVVVEEKEEL